MPSKSLVTIREATQAFTCQSTATDGYVGIGTTTPSALAHFNATDTTGNSVLEALRLSHEDTNSAGANGIGASLTFNLETATNNTFREAAKIEGVFDDATNNSKDGSLRFYTMGPNSTSGTTTTTEKMRMNSSGYLGIGTGSPASRLTVVESVDVEGHMARFTGDGITTKDGTIIIGGNISGLNGEQYITFQNGDSGGNAWMAGMEDDETFRITYETEGEMSSPGFLTILQNGRVGIGTATPNVPFSTNSTGVDAGGNFFMISSFSDPTDSNGIVLGYDSTGTIGVIGANSDLVTPSQLSLRTYSGSAFVEGLRIDGNGKIGIGTSAPSEKLHVIGNLRVQGGTDCTLGNGAGGTNCSSDIRLKENIRQISNPLAKILSLRGVEFEWNEKSQSPGRHDMGVIAQEVERVFPTAVIEDLDTGYKKVDYAVLVAPIIQSLKEINKHLTDLFGLSDKQQNQITSKADRTEVAILREKINQLELKNESQNEQLIQQKKDNYELKRRLDQIEIRLLSNK
ncbi:MAG: tail fiber domain-containing protein [Bdellovibrionales bacterium]|nr:tail fiber domain-containing protein [Bdellovibrionales bacterium]